MIFITVAILFGLGFFLTSKGVQITIKNQTEEPLYNEMVEFVVTQQKASTSLLQRRFRLGYNRAARCIDLLEETEVE